MNKILSIMVTCVFIVVSLGSLRAENNETTISISEEQKINEYVTSELQAIEILSQKIEEEGNEHIRHTLLNERGMKYFFIGELDYALEDFNYVFSKLNGYEDMDNWTGAIIGRLFCHAFKNQVEETYEDVHMIEFFVANCGCLEKIDSLYHRHKNSMCSSIFANPSEKITKRDCIDRVYGISGKIESLIDLIPDRNLRYAIKSVISHLEDDRIKCCENGYHWTECLGPIATVWKKFDEIKYQLDNIACRGINYLTNLLGL